jgi:hypothetical protein
MLEQKGLTQMTIGADGESSSRERAMADRISQMPKTSVSAYLKASRGRATPRVAIKAFCMECVGWNRIEVTKCPASACPLWMYRPFQRMCP